LYAADFVGQKQFRMAKVMQTIYGEHLAKSAVQQQIAASQQESEHEAITATLYSCARGSCCSLHVLSYCMLHRAPLRVRALLLLPAAGSSSA